MPPRFVATLLSAVVFSIPIGGCHSPYYAHRGAAVGGLAGGGVGALVGEAAANNPLAGAVVGSAVGAATGAAFGDALDEIDARGERRVQQALYERQPAGVTLPDVVAMSQSGLSDDVITRHIRVQGFRQPLGAQELIRLREQGVTDRVIAALQDAAAAPAPLQVAAAPAPPVIVREHIYPPPLAVRPYWSYRYAHPRRFHAPRSALRWGVSVGN